MSGFLNRFKQGVKATQGVSNFFFSGKHHGKGMSWLKESVGLGKGPWWSRAIGPAFMAYSAYSGYQEGGVWGATKSVGTDIGTTYLLGRGFSFLGGVAAKATGVGVAAAGLAAAGIGIYGAASGQGFGGALGTVYGAISRPAIHDYAKSHARLEMGTPLVDPFGTAATMRQRSLMAIQNSRVNGRTALGNEATLLYQGYFR